MKRNLFAVIALTLAIVTSAFTMKSHSKANYTQLWFTYNLTHDDSKANDPSYYMETSNNGTDVPVCDQSAIYRCAVQARALTGSSPIQPDLDDPNIVIKRKN